MKSQVEASMMDAIDWPAFKQGFYVCTSVTTKTDNVYKIKSKDQYSVITCGSNPNICDSDGNILTEEEIADQGHKISKINNQTNCKAMVAEYKIIAGEAYANGNVDWSKCPANNDNVTADDGFACLLRARLDSILKDGYDSKKFNYTLEVTDIIEYPPKVSVTLTYQQEIRNSLNNETDDIPVVNQIDAILEDDGTVSFMEK